MPPVVDRCYRSLPQPVLVQKFSIQKHTQSTTKTKWVDNHYNSNSMRNTIPNLKALEIKGPCSSELLYDHGLWFKVNPNGSKFTYKRSCLTHFIKPSPLLDK